MTTHTAGRLGPLGLWGGQGSGRDPALRPFRPRHRGAGSGKACRTHPRSVLTNSWGCRGDLGEHLDAFFGSRVCAPHRRVSIRK